MPEMDGPELLQTLRRAGNQTPFVFLTGFRDLSVSELLALGAARVLDKPFEPAALAEALRAVVPAQASVSSR
jgi:CheY-like chemotaxis protein